LDFSTIKLQPKYPTQIKLKKRKIDSLQKIRKSLGAVGYWIPDLIETQKAAEEYNEDDDGDEIFPKNLNSNDEVPKVVEKAAEEYNEDDDGGEISPNDEVPNTVENENE